MNSLLTRNGRSLVVAGALVRRLRRSVPNTDGSLDTTPLRILVRLAVLVGFIVLTGILPANVRAATTTITICDQATLDGAISSASSGDTIAFGCSGVIALSQTLSFAKDLTLDGTGQSVTLDGQNSVQVISVSSGVHLTLNTLTIAHGYSFLGGGLYTSGGIVTILNSTFTGNFAYYGGGELNLGGTVSVTNSTFTGNSAFFTGGGLNSSGTLTISNSTVTNNSGPYAAGGIENYAGTLIITNTTVTNNSTASIGSGGGGIWTNSTLSLTYSTVANNSGGAGDGGIKNEGSFTTIGGSIIANNSGGNCSGIVNTDSGYNLESGSDCGFTGTGDLQNTNPMLDLNGLQDNGGPTQTIALLAGSPAVDTGSPDCPPPTTDQRGVARPQAAACDIGAFELPAPSDATPPVIVASVGPAPNAAGWNNTNVTVTWTITDNESSISSSTGCGPTNLTAETAGTILTCEATSAGGTASVSVTVKIDKTAPALAITSLQSPQDGFMPAQNLGAFPATVGAQPVIVSGSIDGSLSGVSSVTVNGGPATFGSGTWTKTNVPWSSGPTP